MLARFISNQDKKEVIKESCRGLNVNEEYLGALRTKSYVDFFMKAQSLVNEPSSSPNYCPEILLEPQQEAVKSIIESTIFLLRKSNLKALLFNYFEISAEASKICSHLLRSINQLQSNYQLIKQMLEIIDDHSPDDQQLNFLVSELYSFIFLRNPLFDLNNQDFKQIHDKYSSVLQHLKSKRKWVVRKIKFIRCFNKAFGVCVTTTCSVVAVVAMVLAAHALEAIVIGPALISLPIKPLKKKLINIRFMKCEFLRKARDHLDVAAKGTYILNRDFDTMSGLVTGLHDEIEHKKAMIQCCLDRGEDRFSLQILQELKKSDFEFKKQVEELQEHVYLCLVTINQARALVVKEIAKSS